MSHVRVTAAHGAGSKVYEDSTYEVSESGVLEVRSADGEKVVFSPIGWSRVVLLEDADLAAAVVPAPREGGGRLRHLLGIGA